MRLDRWRLLGKGIALTAAALLVLTSIATAAPRGERAAVEPPAPALAPPRLVTPTPAPTTTAHPLTGVAILGDSAQDEYQSDQPRGAEYAPYTYNWVEVLVALRDLDVGSWARRTEPRRTGYKYNWARSGAKAAEMLEEQVAGVVNQIHTGAISHVLIQIGLNDFGDPELLFSIYEGAVSEDEIRARFDPVIDAIEQSVRIVRSAGNVEVLLAPIQDYFTFLIAPESQDLLSDPIKRRRLIDAMAYVNGRLEAFAEREGIDYFDFNAAVQAELTRRLTADQALLVGDERIDLKTRGNEPHHALLDDEYVHPGTVLSGLYANLYIEELNARYGASIEPLSDEEILELADIRP